MTREEARRDINGRPLTDFISLETSRKAGRNMYNCPVCGSGNGKNGTGALHIYPDSNRVFCYSRGCFTDKGEDTLGALRIIWHCEEGEALERAGYKIEKGKKEQPIAATRKDPCKDPCKREAQEDNSLFYRQCNEALKKSPEALDYLHGRGITDASIDRFNLGYCEAWKHSKAGANVPTTKRIIIPRTAGTYTARRIDKPANDIEANYTKQLQGRQKDLFNLEAIQGATPIICEGELDAISLYQAGASSVVGIGSTSNKETLLNEAKKNPEAVFILALDNDGEVEDTHKGRGAQLDLAQKMLAAGLNIYSVDPAKIYGEAKDANEALVKDPERLKKIVASLEGQAQAIKATKDEEREEELRKRTGEGMLEDFLLTVTQREFEPIPTGIKDLDRALEGGFTRKTLVMLGAAPGMGKTALAQWIFENMAYAGHDVLYINLEMAREQLLARSISRYAWKYQKKDINALEVLRGYAWDDRTKDAVLKAAEQYKKDIAPHFIYNPEGVDNSIDSILTAMITETARIKAQGKPAPLVCIDYLQLIDSGERDAIEGMKGVIAKLKNFAREAETVVFVIMANNRASNRTGTAELESGRDTSAIEYSGDVMLGLAYTAIEDRRKYETGEDKHGNILYEEYTLDTLRRLKKEAYEEGRDIPAVCNELCVKVLKNRFGEAERRANLIFDGKHTTFNMVEYRYTDIEEEVDEDGWTTYQGNSPFEE